MKHTIIVFFVTVVMSCVSSKSILTEEQLSTLVEAQPIKVVQPRFPLQAVLDKTEGYVRFVFDIAPNGYIENIRKIKSEPKGVFDHEALNALKQWRFKPAEIDGKTVSQPNMTYTLEFKMAPEYKQQNNGN